MKYFAILSLIDLAINDFKVDTNCSLKRNNIWELIKSFFAINI
jgi:hypothetical protein